MKTFGWTRPVRDNSGTVIDSKPSPVRVRTLETLGTGYGPDSNKRLIFTARPKDLIGIRPERTNRELLISAKDLYSHLIRTAANRAVLEKARDKKAVKRVLALHGSNSNEQRNG